MAKFSRILIYDEIQRVGECIWSVAGNEVSRTNNRGNSGHYPNEAVSHIVNPEDNYLDIFQSWKFQAAKIL